MTDKSDKKAGSPSFEDMGRRVDDEIEKLISYLNDEVVPSVRSHSTKAMRIAASKLSQFADYMEQQPETRKPDPEDDTGS